MVLFLPAISGRRQQHHLRSPAGLPEVCVCALCTKSPDFTGEFFKGKISLNSHGRNSKNQLPELIYTLLCYKMLLDRNKKENFWFCATPCTKINFKWIIEINVKPKFIKHLKLYYRTILWPYIRQIFGFLDTIPKIPSMIRHIDKVSFIKTENFCSLKDTVKTKGQFTPWKKYL